ncbi:hypothetical protein BGZ80_002404 [Entomortierella chlamydospora]|uniref:FAD-binding domain-containing protein n=1 Tax=Entomortierella chlamydospora TaxID=101097 RepID=A0A9P6MQ65_9FUNG|nr:hypothetical protein BGZ80_002404 [Entomortierella chlamydospora]
MVDMTDLADVHIPTVLIVGAGLGGLMLGAVLKSANISYHILERAAEPRPLEFSIAISANILPVFEQLGIYEELKSVSLPLLTVSLFDKNLVHLGDFGGPYHKIVTGYDIQMLARPKLYDILHRKVPSYKISRGKKVLRTKEHDDRVTVYCSDGTEYDCSILVGADGAYSAVRQSMYKKLDEEGNLPLIDKEDLTIGYITMVGVSTPLNPEKYPQLSETDRSYFHVVVGDKNDSHYFVTVPDNQICWGIKIQLPEHEAKQQQFKNFEWGPESVDIMLKEYENFPCAFGGTMEDLFDTTPKHLISKVFLEETVFQTWYHGRSVLIGDACHKLLPGGGEGAAMAMRDAVVLANCLYNMSDKSDKSIKGAFANYYRQRYLDAEDKAKSSAISTRIMSGHLVTEEGFYRHI